MITLEMYFTHVTGYRPSNQAVVLLGANKESGQWRWWDQSAVASGILDGRWQSPPYGYQPSNTPQDTLLAISTSYWMLHDISFDAVKPYLCEIELTA